MLNKLGPSGVGLRNYEVRVMQIDGGGGRTISQIGRIGRRSASSKCFLCSGSGKKRGYSSK